MPHGLALALETMTTVLTVAGMGYFLTAIVAARVYLRERSMPLTGFAPGVSILKSLKGLDPGMLDAFRSHCRQSYAGEFEMLFGVSSLDDPARAAVERLKAEFPELAIRLVECPQRLGTNGKVSTLLQLATHARHDFLLINDSDITVSPRYLERVMECFGPGFRTAGGGQPPVGLVTALYRGHSQGTLGSRLEALGIATDFMAGLLVSLLVRRRRVAYGFLERNQLALDIVRIDGCACTNHCLDVHPVLGSAERDLEDDKIIGRQERNRVSLAVIEKWLHHSPVEDIPVVVVEREEQIDDDRLADLMKSRAGGRK